MKNVSLQSFRALVDRHTVGVHYRGWGAGEQGNVLMLRQTTINWGGRVARGSFLRICVPHVGISSSRMMLMYTCFHTAEDLPYSYNSRNNVAWNRKICTRFSRTKYDSIQTDLAGTTTSYG